MRHVLRSICHHWAPRAPSAFVVPTSSPAAPLSDTVSQMPAPPFPAAMNQHRRLPPAALSQADLAPGEASSLCLIYRDGRVQCAADALRHDLQRLIEAGTLGLIAEAVQRARNEASHLAPENVLAALLAMRAEVVEEIATMAVERAAHSAKLRDAMAPIQALRNQVAQREADAQSEAAALRRQLQAFDEWRPGSGHDRRYALSLHLSAAQMAALGQALVAYGLLEYRRGGR